MSALQETRECFPREIRLGHGLTLPAGEPDHEHCPVGQHTPGVLGGWHCPCPCHNGAHNKRDAAQVKYEEGGRWWWNRAALDEELAHLREQLETLQSEFDRQQFENMKNAGHLATVAINHLVENQRLRAVIEEARAQAKEHTDWHWNPHIVNQANATLAILAQAKETE